METFRSDSWSFVMTKLLEKCHTKQVLSHIKSQHAYSLSDLGIRNTHSVLQISLSHLSHFASEFSTNAGALMDRGSAPVLQPRRQMRSSASMPQLKAVSNPRLVLWEIEIVNIC